MNALIEWIQSWTAWDLVGFVGQALFLSRFIVQWIATERQKKSVVPVAFWYLSMGGTIILLVYSFHLKNPVFILGFSLNMIIYLRNLYFIHLHPRKVAAAMPPSNDSGPNEPPAK